MNETELLADVPDGLFIGGEWRAAGGGTTMTVQDPSTGDTIKTIADASVDDGKAAMDAAAAASASWAATAAARARRDSCAARSTRCRSAPRTSRC